MSVGSPLGLQTSFGADPPHPHHRTQSLWHGAGVERSVNGRNGALTCAISPLMVQPHANDNGHSMSWLRLTPGVIGDRIVLSFKGINDSIIEHGSSLFMVLATMNDHAACPSTQWYSRLA